MQTNNNAIQKAMEHAQQRKKNPVTKEIQV